MGYLFDLIALVIFGGCVVLGFWRGFIRELFDLIALAAGILAFSLFQRMGVSFFGPVAGSVQLGQLLSSLIVALVTRLLVRWFGRSLRKEIKSFFLRLLDRLAGSVLAIIKAAVTMGFLLILAVRYPILGTDWIKQSILSPLILFAGRLAIFLLPAEFTDSITRLTGK